MCVPGHQRRGQRAGPATHVGAHVGEGHPGHLADLFDDDLDAVAVTLDSRYSPPSVAKLWPPSINGGSRQG